MSLCSWGIYLLYKWRDGCNMLVHQFSWLIAVTTVECQEFQHNIHQQVRQCWLFMERLLVHQAHHISHALHGLEMHHRWYHGIELQEFHLKRRAEFYQCCQRERRRMWLVKRQQVYHKLTYSSGVPSLARMSVSSELTILCVSMHTRRMRCGDGFLHH